MNSFRVVKRTSLPSQSRFNGSSPGAPHVRLHKTGNLNFSKLACEVFAHRPMCVAEYDEEARTLKLTAVDKPPRGLEEEDCFRLVWHQYKGLPFNAVLAAKRLLRYLGFEYSEPVNLSIASINPEAHSMVLQLPAVGELVNQAGAGEDQAGAAPNHGQEQPAVNRL